MDNKNKQPLTHDKNAYKRAYYEKHKNDYYIEIFTCELCGGQYKRTNKSHHYKSRRHRELVEYNNMKKELESTKK